MSEHKETGEGRRDQREGSDEAIEDRLERLEKSVRGLDRRVEVLESG